MTKEGEQRSGGRSKRPAGSRGNGRAGARERRETPPPSPTDGGILAAVSAWFGQIATATANAVGSPWAFLVALTIVGAWAISGPLFGFSDTWQLVINTGTTIVTFLMVFLIQNTQNRDARALHIKLDEVIRALHAARNEIIDVEESTDEELARLQEKYRELRERADQAGGRPADGQPAQPAAGKRNERSRRETRGPAQPASRAG